MFFYVYVLCSIKDGKLYIGYCNDLKVRIEKHNKGYVPATKNRRPLVLIHYEAYREEQDAKQREKFLKGGKGHEEIKIQLRKVLDKVGYKY